MIVETSLPIGKLLMSLPANGLVFLVIPMTKGSAQCMSHYPASYIQFYIFKLLIFIVSLLLVCFRNLPYMELGGIISPSIGKLSRLQRLWVKCLSLLLLHLFIFISKQNRKWVKAFHAKFPTFPVNFFWWYRALHQNSLHGSIPYEITQCTELRAM